MGKQEHKSYISPETDAYLDPEIQAAASRLAFMYGPERARAEKAFFALANERYPDMDASKLLAIVNSRREPPRREVSEAG